MSPNMITTAIFGGKHKVGRYLWHHWSLSLCHWVKLSCLTYSYAVMVIMLTTSLSPPPLFLLPLSLPHTRTHTHIHTLTHTQVCEPAYFRALNKLDSCEEGVQLLCWYCCHGNIVSKDCMYCHLPFLCFLCYFLTLSFTLIFINPL